MSEIKTSFEYNLSSPIKYSDNGEFVESDLLVLYAPNWKQSRYASKISQQYIRARSQLATSDLMDKLSALEPTQSVEKDKDDEDTAARGMIEVFKMSAFDIHDILEMFTQLLRTGVAQIEDKTRLSEKHLEAISLLDLELMLGRYINSFLEPTNT